MAFLAAALPYIATAVTAYSAIRQGTAANAVARSEAAQMEDQANAERAASQRAYLEEKRQARYVSSRAQAVAAASGAGVSDPTVANIISGIEGEGEYRALSRLYQGDVTAQGLQYGAQVRRKEGRAAKTAGYLSAASTVLSGASSLYGKYGAGGPSTRAANPGRGGALVYDTPPMRDFTIDQSSMRLPDVKY